VTAPWLGGGGPLEMGWFHICTPPLLLVTLTVPLPMLTASDQDAQL